MKTKAETVEGLQAAIQTWERMEKAVRFMCPDADDEEVYEKTKAAMNLALEQAKEGRGATQ